MSNEDSLKCESFSFSSLPTIQPSQLPSINHFPRSVYTETLCKDVSLSLYFPLVQLIKIYNGTVCQQTTTWKKEKLELINRLVIFTTHRIILPTQRQTQCNPTQHHCHSNDAIVVTQHKPAMQQVEDVNDNYPVFGPHRTAISVREDVRVPFVIETFEASDQDEGRFGQVIYKLDELDDSSSLQTSSGSGKSSSSSISSMFSIETIDGKGVLSLMRPLDYEQKPLYQLRIIAIDRAVEHERLSATTSLLISVEDCEDQAPMFTFVPSITRIPEDLPVGSPIVRVTAIDGDRGVNNPIQYKLISVNGQESGYERQLFAIDQDSGQISIAGELDRESGADGWLQGAQTGGRKSTDFNQSGQPGSYVLKVKASEVSSQPGSSASSTGVTTELTIILTDVNDEAPSFSQTAYFGEILENSAAESLVHLVAGPQAQSTANQQTLILDPQQQPVAKVTDRDQGTNGTFTLHLEGEHSQLFDIWPREATNEANFMIKINHQAYANGLASKLLDFERNKMFQFSIVAREKYASYGNMRSNSVSMTVYLKDSNDNYPQFESELYRVEIPENAIKGMHICTVRTTDLDSGIYGTQGIRYTEIRGEKASKFKLDPLTGMVTLKTNDHGFDRETIAQHHLIVEARDNNGSGNRNTSQLLIILTDVNDQKPKFLLDQYEAFIYENELDFQSPLQVQAIDNDAQNSPNSRISYSIVGGDPMGNFTIDPQTGRIRVKTSLMVDRTPAPNINRVLPSNRDSDISILEDQPLVPMTTQPTQAQQMSGLDFERIAQKRDDTRLFNLTIKATDAGLPESLSDTTHVIVLVYDKNDHAPVFTRNIYSKSIREDAKEGSQVLQVLAQDGDHSPTNSKITYRISSGASDKFVIDSDSGLISVANGANLDIDRVVGGQKRTNYLLNVLAFDGSFGPNQKSSSCLVNITIIDVNNKPPEFISLGALRSTANLMTTTSSPNLGGGSLQNNGPSGHNNLMVVNVNEDAPYGLIVTRVVAIDLDSNAELRYSINYARSEARNEDMILVEPSLIRDLFSIEPTDGTIKVAKQLDRELFDQVKLRLQVEDIAAQTPDQIAHSYLLVRITDVNDNRPTFKRPVYKAVVNENSISGTSILTITADDRDLNKTLKYSLEAEPEMIRLVRINPRSGEVIVNDKIDRELYPLINVTVRAEDYGHPHPLTGTCQLLITVRDENDNNPIFLNGTQMRRSDSDSGIAYGISSDLPNNHLNITPSNGYRLRSLGRSAGSITLNGQNDLTGGDFVAPGNEQPDLPLLSGGSSARVREDAPIGHQVAYVRAEDADIGNNGRVTYLLEGTSSGGKFRIDRDTGIISVAGVLDRETARRYSLIIEACDNYDLGYSTGESRRAFTQVNIIITDTNDNSPIISTNLQAPLATGSSNLSPTASSAIAASVSGGLYPSYEDVMQSSGPYQLPLADCLFISEFQALNEPILTVTATDADDPLTLNGQIDLAILNNLPQNELFGLVSIPNSNTNNNNLQRDQLANGGSTLDKFTQSNPVDLSGFGESTGEAAIVADGQTNPSSSTGLPAEPISMAEDAHESSSSEEQRVKVEAPPSMTRAPALPSRTKRWALHLTEASGHSPVAAAASASTRTGGSSAFSLMGAQQTISSIRQRQQPFYAQAANRQQLPIPTTTTSTSTTTEAPIIRSQRLIETTITTTTDSPTSYYMSATMSSVGHNHHLRSRQPPVISSGQIDNVYGEQQAYIVVSQSLKEKVGNYSILVRATDRGQPSLSSVKMINICVQDVNNHAPVFTRPPLNHTIRIMENATIGTHVTQVEATDADHGVNGDLHYSLKPTNIQNNNNDWQSFKIDRLTGVISTAKLFNRQLKKYYTLRVQAQDFGKPTSLSSDIDINIMIVNSGQYQPEFEAQSQTLQFTENVAPGVEWFTLLPTTNLDEDPALIHVNSAISSPSGNSQPGGPNSASPNWLASPCYFIVDGDDDAEQPIFHLDRYTHRLTNQRVIDREKKPNYTLIVQATNNCNKVPLYKPVKSASSSNSNANQKPEQTVTSISTTLSSVGIDYRANDEGPLGGEQSLSNDPQVGEFRGQRVARSSPVSSSGDNLKKSNSPSTESQTIAGTNSPTHTSHRVGKDISGYDSSSGAPPVGTTTFNPVAADTLIQNDRSFLKVIIRIKDVNDNAPKFTQKVYTGGITTEADFGTVFMIVQAMDMDADANSQVVYSIVKPIKKNLVMGTSLVVAGDSASNSTSDNLAYGRRVKRATITQQTTYAPTFNPPPQPTTTRPQYLMDDLAPSNSNSNKRPDIGSSIIANDIPMSESDDLFVINSQTGEISLNFDPQKHMKGYFEFEIVANDTEGLSDSAKVFIYLLRQDQRVKFVLRLTPQELRQRLNKFRSVFGNITGAIVNIDSYKYFENHDGTVDKKKTSLYLHFVNPEDNTIIDVDKVLTLIDNNIEYLDELYKEFHVLSSEAAHSPLSSSALVDPIDQIRTGLVGISSFLALILLLVIGLCLNQRTRYERQLKAATVSAFGSPPLHLDPNYHSQTNLPNTNLHSQDPNPIWVNGFSEQDWLGGAGGGNGKSGLANNHSVNQQEPHQKNLRHQQQHPLSIHDSATNQDQDDGSHSETGSDMNSLGANQLHHSHHHHLHYNGAPTATPRDSLSSSHGQVSSGSGSGSTSTTNERQALCHRSGRQTPLQVSAAGAASVAPVSTRVEVHQSAVNIAAKLGVTSSNGNGNTTLSRKRAIGGQQVEVGSTQTTSRSTFGAFKEVTIYTDHQQQAPQMPYYAAAKPQQQQQQQGNLIRTVNQQQQPTSQVNKIASQFNAKQALNGRTNQSSSGNQGNQVYQVNPTQQQHSIRGQPKMIVHANGTDLSQGIVKHQGHTRQQQQQHQSNNRLATAGNEASRTIVVNGGEIPTAKNYETSLNKLSILNLETTEL